VKRLAILRHAKSSWDDPSLADFDRPLNGRGRRSAIAVGQELKRKGIAFDFVLASTAVRVRETLQFLEEGYGSAFEVRFEPRIYEASTGTMLELIRAIPEQATSALLVGHNPAFGRLAEHLTVDDPSGLRRRIEIKYPTGTLALMEFGVPGWEEVQPGSGRIVELMLPRELV